MALSYRLMADERLALRQGPDHTKRPLLLKALLLDPRKSPMRAVESTHRCTRNVRPKTSDQCQGSEQTVPLIIA